MHHLVCRGDDDVYFLLLFLQDSDMGPFKANKCRGLRSVSSNSFFSLSDSG